MIDIRPWGWMVKLVDLKFAWFKFIRVIGRTSLQKHKKRDEYFVGVWRVKRNEEHRLQRGFFIEISLGDCKEEDIERLSDDYGRN